MSEDEAKTEVKEAEEEASTGEEPSEEEAEAPEPPKKRTRKATKAPKKKDKEDSEDAKKGAKKKKRTAKKHPKTIDMVVEAIDNMMDKKGSSVQAIKSYIQQNFKSVRADMIKAMLRRALASGLQQGIFVRPKGQAETQGMSGRYLLGKAAKVGEEEEVMPQQSKRAQEAKKASAKGKKKGKKGKKVAKKPVARKASPKKKSRSRR